MADADVMSVHVEHANRVLLDGGHVVQALEDLWRAAYAAGVRRGQDGSAYTAGGTWKVRVTQGGWRWGSAIAMGLGQGSRFSYGGTDPDQPTVDRAGAITDRGRLTFFDTGGVVSLPAMFWAKVAPEEGKSDG